MATASRAEFSTTGLRLLRHRQDMDERASCASGLTVMAAPGNNAVAIGDTQQIMFLIGHVAATGEDSLISVTRIT